MHSRSRDVPPRRTLGRRLRVAWELVSLVLTGVGLALVLWVEIAGLEWPEPEFRRLAVIDLGFVGIFGVELVVRLVRAPDRWAFLRANWYELPGLIPLYAESASILRGTKVLRILRLFRLLRAGRLVRELDRQFALGARVLRRSRLGTILVAGAGVVVVMATVVWVLERRVNPALATFGEALWWAVVTATTVGYGDVVPQTWLARSLATGLMLVGIGLIGSVASSLSLAMVAESEGRPEDEGLAEGLERLAGLHDRGKLTDDEFARAKAKLLAER